jgi:hypothetical protein
LESLPAEFVNGDFIILNAHADINKEAIIFEEAAHVVTNPVAILSAEFEPIAATTMLFFVP